MLTDRYMLPVVLRITVVLCRNMSFDHSVFNFDESNPLEEPHHHHNHHEGCASITVTCMNHGQWGTTEDFYGCPIGYCIDGYCKFN